MSEMATRAFFLYGGEPEYNFNAIGAAGGGGGGMLATTIGPNITAAGAPSFIGSPMGNMNPAMLQTPGPGLNILFFVKYLTCDEEFNLKNLYKSSYDKLK